MSDRRGDRATAVPGGLAASPARFRVLTAAGGGFVTRYHSWGTSGPPIGLVPGAFETVDTFAALGAVLAREHRVFAIDHAATARPGGLRGVVLLDGDPLPLPVTTAVPRRRCREVKACGTGSRFRRIVEV